MKDLQVSTPELFLEEELTIKKRIEFISFISGIILFFSALWCLLPIFTNNIDPLKVLAPAVVALFWVGFIPDFPIENSTTRSRIGGTTSIIWIPVLVIGLNSLLEDSFKFLGSILLISSSLILLFCSRKILFGSFKVIRYRTLMYLVGIFAGFSVLVPFGFEEFKIGYLGILFGLVILIFDWFGSDEERLIRREFKQRLDIIEGELLIERSKGRAVDQAASLVLSASQEGHLDPNYGLELLNRAKDSMVRVIRLEKDILEIKKDSELIINQAENITPLIKNPRRTFVQAEREIELGSLEESELLFRLSKKQASEIIEWWEKAELAIKNAKKLLIKHDGHAVESLHSQLIEAENYLENEKPKLAFDFAISIPAQIESVEENFEITSELFIEVKQKLDAAEGLNLDLWHKNHFRASEAISRGDYSLARGLLESILRELDLERESMEKIRIELNQRSKLRSKWEILGNSEKWDRYLEEIEDFAKKLEWSHASILLDRLVDNLEIELESFNEANELLNFAKKEWFSLREECDKKGINNLDEQRIYGDNLISNSHKKILTGDVQEGLNFLGDLDLLMEKLRRRI
ncbi:MAG: hypothetical protein CMB56_004295 [Methanobacteriota archaeon]|nr:MAG: hypothetical protein CMB56_004295 [Euryarchaeota archaeon]